MIENKMASCLYHSKNWRGDLQFILNQIHGKLIPVCYMKNLATKVCVCKCTDTADEDDCGVPFSELYPFLQEEKTTALFDTIMPILLKMLRDEDCALSRNRLLALLKKAAEKDFSDLRPSHQSTKVPKYPVCANLTVLLPKYLRSRLVGKNGHNMKRLGQKHEVRLTFDERENHNNPLSTTITVKTKTKDDILMRKVEKDLSVLADEIRRKVSSRVTRCKYSKLTGWGQTVDAKTANKVLFEKKKSGMLQDKRKNHKPAPVLSNSRCINCLAAYTTGMSRGRETCKYHQGFVVNDKWSCCGLERNADQSLKHSHSDSGCKTGDVHNWRPTKNLNQKYIPSPHWKLRASEQMHNEW